jgi:hypothetical protein
MWNMDIPPLFSASDLELFHSSSYEQVKKWMDVCQNQHPACFQEDTKPFLPSRLIDVGIPDGEFEPRLILTDGEEFCGIDELPGSRFSRHDYVTLSYC